MSYDITLNDPATGKISKVESFLMTGGTVPFEIVNGKLVQAKQVDAWINITYNYAKYYYEVTKDDERFAHRRSVSEDADYGIRGIYGKTGAESIPLLQLMIDRIHDRYVYGNEQWKISERKKIHYYDERGREIDSPIHDILHGEKYYTREETYKVSEGDTDNYWEATAANAIRPLRQMIGLAEQCPDSVWEGD